MALPPFVRRALDFLAPLPLDGQAVGPIREASPEDDGAAPTEGMLSRSGETSFIPDSWLKSIAQNTDSILARDGTGLRLFDALLDDETAFSTLQQRRLAITSRDWEVVPGDEDDPRSVTAADDFRAMIDGLGFDRVTGLLHYSVWYGYGVAEALYGMRERDGRTIVWLEDIVVPDRRHFGFTHEGELRFTAAIGYGDGLEVPPNKFLTIRTGGTHDFAFYGLGLAHWCYWPIFFKRSALKFWALYLEKLGRPTAAMEFTQAQNNPKDKALLLQAAMAIGQDSAVLVPEGTLANNLLKVIEPTRVSTGGSGYAEFVGEQNEAIMRVVLGQPGTSKGVSSGLNSDQASEHADVKAEIVKADSDLITDAVQRTFGKWITRWNHGPGVAPPILRRVLDDGEDLTTTAERDATLDGIGIRRSEDSVKATYGDGYEVDRVSAAEKDANDRAIAAAKVGLPDPTMDFASSSEVARAVAWLKKAIALHEKHMSGDAPTTGKAGEKSQMTMMRQMKAALAALEDDDPKDRRGKMEMTARIAEFAAQGGETAFSPLYVLRKLLNPGPLIAWARKQGFKSIVPADDMHVTVIYSKDAVDWFAMGTDYRDEVTIREGGPRFVEVFGPGGDNSAVVLRFESSDLSWRHGEMIERGASTDYPDYKAHVTISYSGPGEVDLEKVEPFTGELRFGPEIFEPIKADPSPTFAAEMNTMFAADEDAAIERLVDQLSKEANPVFVAMGEKLRGALEGVTSVEGARVALLKAIEDLPTSRLAEMTALPMLAVRAGALVGADGEVTA